MKTARFQYLKNYDSGKIQYIEMIIKAVDHKLFHRRTRASYVYNGCLAWYNVVLTHGSTQA